MESTLTSTDASSTDWDVVVVGCGTAGAAAALGAARQGLRTLIVERSEFPRPKVCGGCLNGRAMSVLDRAGALDAVRAAGAKPLHQFHLAAMGSESRMVLPSGLGISRSTLDQTLAEQCLAAGCAIVFGASAKLGATEPDHRIVALTHEGREASIRARVIVAADGLHGSFMREETGRTQVAENARVGVGAISRDTTGRYEPGTIHMAVAPQGYVGATIVEEGVIDMAAAFDPGFLRAAGSPRAAVESVLSQAGLPVPRDIEAMAWKGTPPLTRRAPALHAERVLVAGDSAGYIEPFTGEGMAWALSAGWSLAPRLAEAADAWQPAIGQRWEKEYGRVVRRRQWLCRALAWTLRQPPLVLSAMRVLRAWPGAAEPFMQYINRPYINRPAVQQ